MSEDLTTLLLQAKANIVDLHLALSVAAKAVNGLGYELRAKTAGDKSLSTSDLKELLTVLAGISSQLDKSLAVAAHTIKSIKVDVNQD